MMNCADVFIKTFLCGKLKQTLFTLKRSIIVLMYLSNVLCHAVGASCFEVTLLALNERLLWFFLMDIFHMFRQKALFLGLV